MTKTEYGLERVGEMPYHRRPRRHREYGVVGHNDHFTFERNRLSDWLEESARNFDENGISFPQYTCYFCIPRDGGEGHYVMFTKEPLSHKGETPPEDVDIVFIAENDSLATMYLELHRSEVRDSLDLRNIAESGRVPRA